MYLITAQADEADDFPEGMALAEREDEIPEAIEEAKRERPDATLIRVWVPAEELERRWTKR